MADSIRDIVLRLHQDGYSVIPLGLGEDGKGPRIKWGQYKEKQPPRLFVSNWEDKWKPSLWGILMSDTVALLDADTAESYDRMKADLGEPHVISPRPGGHWYIDTTGHPLKNAEKPLPGIDVKGVGGLACLVGRSKKGEYRIQRLPLRSELIPYDSLPEWIKEGLEGSKERAEPGAIKFLDGVPEGERDWDAYKYACRLFGKGLEQVEVTPLVLIAAARCKPPLPPDEALKCIESASEFMFKTTIHQTDTGNALMLAEMFGDSLRYDHRRECWLRWKGHHWSPDDDGHVSRLVVKVAKARQKRAMKIEAVDADKKREFAWGVSTEHQKQINNCLRRAMDTIPLADSGDDWDRDAMLLGGPNGIIDLRTGKRRDGRPEDRITKSIGAVFDSEAECPIWLAFLESATKGDADLIEYLQRAVGYSLTGLVQKLAFFFLLGPSFTGKTTFIMTIRKMMGEYGWKIPTKILMQKDRLYGGPSESIANLRGVRFAYASETEENNRLAAALLKELVSGETMTADKKYEHEREFSQTWKIWLTSNYEPAVSDRSKGFWNRVKVILFESEVSGDQIDETLPAKLEKELPGILNWAIEGCLKQQVDGLREPKSVTDAVEQYRRDQDTIGRFIEDRCIEGQDEESEAGNLRDCYIEWAKKAGIGRLETLSTTLFGTEIGRRYRWKKGEKGKVYYGIGIKPIVEMIDGKLKIDMSEIDR